MPYSVIRDHHIYYEIEGSGAPLLLIAGYACDLNIWSSVRNELSKHFTLILFDNFGSGRSDCPDVTFSIEQMADDTIALVDDLNIHKPHILGHSMGGAIAQSIAHRHGDKIGKLILAQTFVKEPQVGAATIRAALHLIEKDQISLRSQAELMLPWFFSNAFLENPMACAHFFDMQENNPYPTTIVGLNRQFEAMQNFDSRDWHQQIKVPTLVLCCDEDRLCPPSECELMARGIPHSTIHLFIGSGHIPQIEKPDEFCSTIVHYLQGTRSS